MRKRKILVTGATFTFCWLIIAWISHYSTHRPVLDLSVERSGIVDDYGNEMMLGTLSIKNPDNQSHNSFLMYVGGDNDRVEANVLNHWITVDARMGPCVLRSGEKVERQFLLSASITSCRVSTRYGDAILAFEGGRYSKLAARIPPRLRRCIPKYFCRWLGSYGYRKGTNWRELNVELPVLTAHNSAP